MIKPAMPVFTTTPSGILSGGSAFLGDFLGVIYLLTAAHLLPLEHPTTDWSRWGRRLSLIISDRTHDIELFHGTEDARVPVFGHFADDSGFSDALWIELPAPLADHLAQTYQVHALMAEEIVAGELVTVHGYPTDREPWPPEIETVRGPVIGIDAHMLEARFDGEEGFSGGPAVTAAGTFAGMYIGTSADRARIVPAITLRAMMGSRATPRAE
ncbi:hypothetical protein PFZ55_39845 [Streptomyces sp. MS2A]|nr:hypothetical protein [Streptomyces sp. MS2A]